MLPTVNDPAFILPMIPSFLVTGKDQDALISCSRGSRTFYVSAINRVPRRYLVLMSSILDRGGNTVVGSRYPAFASVATLTVQKTSVSQQSVQTPTLFEDVDLRSVELYRP